MTRHSTYETITRRFIEKLKDGVLPWGQEMMTSPRPRNYKNKHVYRGMNWLSLKSRGFESPYFLTFNQARDLDLQVKKGEKGTPILVYNSRPRSAKPADDSEPASGSHRGYFISRAYLFNLEQISGAEDILKELKEEATATLDSAEEIIGNWSGRPEILVAQEPGYDADADIIYLPERSKFHSAAAYYGAQFQLMIRSTGAERRLKRQSATDYTNQKAFEELVAEIGRSFLGQLSGIATEEYLDNALASIQTWIAAMEDDPKYLILASHYASEAVEYIMGEKIERYEEANVDEI